MNNKPVIFFSHSSADKEPILKIKNRIMQITGGAVEIFQSSDGQSIRFGKNWVHAIEEALKRCKVMFVFLSPNSINSKWIYFEAGYVYSKEIDVIPIGLMGVDLNEIQPPLSLLQGFNVKSAGGLNNILTVINRTFQFTFPEAFEDKEYDEIVITSQQIPCVSIFKDFSEAIKAIQFDAIIVDPINTLNKVSHLLEQTGLSPVVRLDEGYITNGVFWRFTSPSPNKEYMIQITAASELSCITFKFIKELIASCSIERNNLVGFVIQFKELYYLPTDIMKLWSMIYQSDIKSEDDKYFRYNDVAFGINNQFSLHVKMKLEEIDSDSIFALFKYLSSLGILTKSFSGYSVA